MADLGTTVRLRVLGELSATRDGVVVDLGGRRQRAVLAALVIARDQVVPDDRLVDCVWGDNPPANTAGALQAYVSHLRRRLQPEAEARQRDGVLAREAAGYVLRLEPDAVDAWCFERALDFAAGLAPADAICALDRSAGPDAGLNEAAAVLTDFAGEAADALLELTGPEAQSPQVLVEVRQMGGAIARGGEHPSAFASRDVAYSLLVVGIAGTPGVEDHAAAILQAMRPWTGGYRLPNFTFTPQEYADAYDDATIARLRRAVRTYDPDGVMAIGGVLT